MENSLDLDEISDAAHPRFMLNPNLNAQLLALHQQKQEINEKIEKIVDKANRDLTLTKNNQAKLEQNSILGHYLR